MGLLDTVFGGGQANAGRAQAAGYGKAMDYMNPYYQGGLADYNKYRGAVGSKGDLLGQYGNPADYAWKSAGLSPQEYYQNLMGGYAQSPQAQYQTDQMQKAAQRGASASGMTGSGTFFDSLQRNQQDIIAQDQDRWLGNMLGVNNQQMGYLQNYQGQENDYMNRLNGLANMGQNSANTMGQYAIGQGNANAMTQMGKGNTWGNMLNMGAGAAMGYMNPGSFGGGYSRYF